MAGDLWVRRFHPSPHARIRLVCFPHAGGSASYFFPVSSALRPAIEVLALQYPGRQDRRSEPSIDDIGELADRLHKAVAPWCRPGTAFFGHSMGAILAFEVARRLERKEGVSPAALIVSGRRGPTTERDETVHLRPDAGLLAELRELSGTDAAMLDEEGFAELILPALRSDYTAIETYRHEPGPPLTCPILALTGDQDPKTTVAEVKDWSRHTSGPFDLKVHPGGHFYLNERSGEVIGDIAGYLRSLPL
ncbi:thioesterase II family protein [Actinomadura opuntiae]|uniref:thioesterase II family protein n=1 Tax=Actinomadura sp. OS1-43 TaxID=604315 RepID=UPI00255ABB3A|nr:alpha/beta fold hydrolase [Actinomadura sp. OS1-43]MDL4817271.1 alpha/beta fold hydrolase [Actinomadura sp. OS1-43]